MKKIALLLCGAALAMSACRKEGVPVPSEQKNWLAITWKENMDNVDQKIHDIWEKYKVGVFYSDTLGYIDYGQLDDEGNHVYTYIMLNPLADMSSSLSLNANYVWTPFNTYTPANKAKLLPMLEFLDTDLLKIAREGNLEIPSVLIVDNYKDKWYANYYPLFRGGNVVIVAMRNFSDDVAIQKEFRRELIVRCMGRRYDEVLLPYYKVTEDLMAAYVSSPWSGATFQAYNSIFTDWMTIYTNYTFLQNYDANMAKLEQELLPLKTKFENGTATTYDITNYQNKIKQIADMRIAKQNENTWTISYNRYRPETYGMIITGTWGYQTGTPTKNADFKIFFNLLMDKTPEELNAAYATFPAVLKRLNLLRKILREQGIDIDKLK